MASKQAPPPLKDADSARPTGAKAMHSTKPTTPSYVCGTAAGPVCERHGPGDGHRDLSYIDVDALKRSILCKYMLLPEAGTVAFGD